MVLVPRVPTDLLIRVHDMIGLTAIPSESLNSATAAFAHPGGPDPAQAVILRLIALRKIPTERAGSGWSLVSDGKRYALTERALFEAAAQAPLRMPKSMLLQDLVFRSHELLAIALSSAPPFERS